MSDNVFDFGMDIPETSWLVDGLIAKSDLTVFLAQAGVGKSFLVEQLAICVTHEIPFLGRDVHGGDVLLIDQDTPTSRLDKRLLMFHNGCGGKLVHKLFKLSNKDLSLSDGSLFRTIAQYPSVVLVVLDALRSIAGRYDTSKNKDMAVLGEMKRLFLNNDVSIALTHHVSEHAEWSIDDYMVGPANAFSLGASSINQDLDTYFVVAAKPNKGNKLSELFLRPVAKRTALVGAEPMVIDLQEWDDTRCFRLNYVTDYNTDCDSDCHRDIVRLFTEDGKGRGAQDVYLDMNQKWGINQVREALRQLAKAGRLTESIKPPKMFEYELAKRGGVSIRPSDMTEEE
ncbi:MAG: AAA family ATPase [Proteobacteria bacterium]|nr:AAA family ATPase [Pseudomonadota bacterium]